MKRFSEQSLSSVVVSPSNEAVDGNIDKKLPFAQGKTNNYTPINNIVTNVRNLFAPYFGLVVDAGKDNQTLRIYCTQFTSEESIWKCLNYKVDGHTCLYDYVASQGLGCVRCVYIGYVYVEYFYVPDINGQVDQRCLNHKHSNIQMQHKNHHYQIYKQFITIILYVHLIVIMRCLK